MRVHAQPTCQATADDILGPKYIPNAPETHFGGRICDSAPNSNNRIIIQGRVLSSHDCETPIPSTLEVWQADESGEYSTEDDDTMACRKILRTNDTGFYVFGTVMPGHYGVGGGMGDQTFRAAHIHVMIRPDDQDKYGDLVTQMYFRSDEEAREHDACSECHAMNDSLIVDLADDPKYKNTKRGRWRIYLSPKE